MNDKVTSLTDRIAMDKGMPRFLATLTTAPLVADLLRKELPKLTKEQQRALATVVAFRFTGAMLPASIEMLRRLPLLTDMHPESIGAALDQLTESGIVGLHLDQPNKTGDECFFYWPEMERIVDAAMADDAPR